MKGNQFSRAARLAAACVCILVASSREVAAQPSISGSTFRLSGEIDPQQFRLVCVAHIRGVDLHKVGGIAPTLRRELVDRLSALGYASAGSGASEAMSRRFETQLKLGVETRLAVEADPTGFTVRRSALSGLPVQLETRPDLRGEFSAETRAEHERRVKERAEEGARQLDQALASIVGIRHDFTPEEFGRMRSEPRGEILRKIAVEYCGQQQQVVVVVRWWREVNLPLGSDTPP